MRHCNKDSEEITFLVVIKQQQVRTKINSYLFIFQSHLKHIKLSPT